MLKDILKFLAIFFLLYIAFATGVINTYSYYVVSQKQLKEDKYPAVPRYGKYVYNTFPISWLPECVDVDNVIELMIL